MIGKILAIGSLALGLTTGPQASAQAISDPQPVNRNATVDSGADSGVTMVTDGNGTWIAAWRSDEPDFGGGIGTDDDVLFARSTDNGARWSAPGPLNTDAATDVRDDRAPAVATDGNGHWIVVWYEVENPMSPVLVDLRFAYSDDNGMTWSETEELTNSPGSDSAPRVVPDGEEGWVVTWISRPMGAVENIMVSRLQRSETGFVVHVPVQMDESSEPSSIVTDGASTWILTWSSIGEGDPDIRVSRSTDHGESWSQAQPLNDYAGADDDAEDLSPLISYDGAGTWTASWSTNRRPNGNGVREERDVWFSTSTDAGLGWSPAKPLYAPVSSASIATDGSGLWVFARGGVWVQATSQGLQR